MPMQAEVDDAVVGAGVLGLAVAHQLALRGRRVLLVERSARAEGASVRNFGMLWPIGQPLGPLADLAHRSLYLWRELLASAKLFCDPCGSLHLAHADDEARVLKEYLELAQAAHRPAEWCDPSEVLRRCPRVNPSGLVGGMFSPVECCVDPRQVIRELPRWLSSHFAVECWFATAALTWNQQELATTRGPVHAGRLWVCSGADLVLLYPDLLRAAGLRLCKLQMLRTNALPAQERLGPMLAGGLTLGHYGNFAACPALPELKRRLAAELPLHLRYGIHVMVAQNHAGELILGDSHEYEAEAACFDKEEIDRLILSYLATMMQWPMAGVGIMERWHGRYWKSTGQPWFIARPESAVTILNGIGGAGMTLSQGLAEQVVAESLGASP